MARKRRRPKDRWIKLVCPRCGNVDETTAGVLGKCPEMPCSADCGAKMIRLPKDVTVKPMTVGKIIFTDTLSSARFTTVGMLVEERQRLTDAKDRAEKAGLR